VLRPDPSDFDPRQGKPTSLDYPAQQKKTGGSPVALELCLHFFFGSLVVFMVMMMWVTREE
jgi:hypothetical protein